MPIPYPPVREADVAVEWTLWRRVELKQKRNLPLYYPISTETNETRRIGNRINFFRLLLEGVERGEITAYDPAVINDEFASNQIRTYEQIIANPRLRTESRQQQDVSIITGLDTVIIIEGRDILRQEECVRLILKEKWYFDKRHSKLEFRVIGICPIFIYTEGGKTVEVPIMWIYMPEARPLLARHIVYNDNNDAQNISFDDFFMQKLYSGLIERQSNVYNDRYISDYTKGLDALFEAKKIEEEIFNFEQDLWEY